MRTRRTSVICTMLCLCSLLCASCTTPLNSNANRTETVRPTPTIAPPTPTAQVATPTRVGTPFPVTSYKRHTLLRGVGRPDDLAFDTQERLLFSDFHNGTINRLNSDGTVTVLHRGLAGPEGMVQLPDGTLIVAEQTPHRIISFAPGATTSTVLRKLPGTPAGPPCKDGVDNIALDPTNNTLIIPDSPTGEVYRMSLDGKTFTKLPGDPNLVRPVGAVVNGQGDIFVADECGGLVEVIRSNGVVSALGGLSKPDDVALDSQGNLLIIDLGPGIHALKRVKFTPGLMMDTIASQGFIEPQGLIVDKHGNIFVADDGANVIVEFTPPGVTP